MAFIAPHPAQFAAFKTWSHNVFVPALDQAIGALGLDSIDKILSQYSSISRTKSPSGLDLGARNEFHDQKVIENGILFLGVETYFCTDCGSEEGGVQSEEGGWQGDGGRGCGGGVYEGGWWGGEGGCEVEVCEGEATGCR